MPIYQDPEQQPETDTAQKRQGRKAAYVTKRHVDLTIIALNAIALVAFGIAGGLFSYHHTASGVEAIGIGVLTVLLGIHLWYRYRYLKKRKLIYSPLVLYVLASAGLAIHCVYMVIQSADDIAAEPDVSVIDYSSPDPFSPKFTIRNTLSFTMEVTGAICVPPAAFVPTPLEPEPRAFGNMGLCAKLERSQNWQQSARMNKALQYSYLGELKPGGPPVTVQCRALIWGFKDAPVALGIEYERPHHFWGLRGKRERFCRLWLTAVDTEGKMHLEPQRSNLRASEVRTRPGESRQQRIGIMLPTPFGQ
jgi:hypothetical protein